jgi:hypothetical protein
MQPNDGYVEEAPRRGEPRRFHIGADGSEGV